MSEVFGEGRLSRSLLGLLLGGSGLGWGGSGSGGLSLDAHLGVLHSQSLLLTDGVLGSSGLGLSLEFLLTEDLSLALVDSLDEHILVLELVTLGGEVKLMVHLAIDLLLVSISAKETTEDALAAHPQDLHGHTCVPGTLSLTEALMATYLKEASSS